jgi:hypothetical protein
MSAPLYIGTAPDEVRRSLWDIYKIASRPTSKSYAAFFTCSALGQSVSDLDAGTRCGSPWAWTVTVAISGWKLGLACVLARRPTRGYALLVDRRLMSRIVTPDTSRYPLPHPAFFS